MGLNPVYRVAACSQLAASFEKIGQTDSALYYFETNAAFPAENGGMYVLAANLRSLIMTI